MAISNFKPQIWQASILRTLEDNLVGKKICRAPFTGEIKKKGDSVYFPTLADPTVTTYAGTVTYEDLVDGGLTMNIDQAQYFAFKLDDVDKAQANQDVKGSQSERAAYKLAQAADTYIMGLHAQAGLTHSGTITSANVLSMVGTVAQKLQQQNVYDKNMFMVIPPWLRLKLELAGIKFAINNGINGTGGMAWTDQLGFDLYVTNQVVNTNTVDSPVSEVLAGSYNSIAFANQITETENVRLLDSFSDAVRGLHLYGAKVVKPLELVKFTATWAAESAI